MESWGITTEPNPPGLDRKPTRVTMMKRRYLFVRCRISRDWMHLKRHLATVIRRTRILERQLISSRIPTALLCQQDFSSMRIGWNWHAQPCTNAQLLLPTSRTVFAHSDLCMCQCGRQMRSPSSSTTMMTRLHGCIQEQHVRWPTKRNDTSPELVVQTAPDVQTLSKHRDKVFVTTTERFVSRTLVVDCDEETG
jgi:hypothetical protein